QLVCVGLRLNVGCHARSVPQDPWEEVVNRFNDYFRDQICKADEVMTDIKNSQISRELDTLIQDSMSELAMYKDDLQAKVVPYSQDAADKLGRDLQELTNRLGDHMSEARDQMEKSGKELQSVMEQNVEDVRFRLSAYTRKLRKLRPSGLRASTSNNMEDVRTRLDPYFAKVLENAQAKVTTLNDLLKSQAEKVKEKMQTVAEDIKEHFEKTSEDLRSTLEDKMEELKTWFQPIVSRISDNAKMITIIIFYYLGTVT
uniref:Apolipoprotein Ea n=1 Tax=Cyclopterus lumpus TaxID=8103 RepID=A0A8C3GA25_CYCLU